MDKDVIRNILRDQGYTIVLEKRYRTYAWRFKLSNGTSVYCGDANKVWYAGENKKEVKAHIDSLLPVQNNNKVFVVYGRDTDAKTALLRMLEDMGTEALAIDMLPTQGNTIIEQLETYIPQANYGVVLATPDDIGYLFGHENEAKYRARQNVVLEMGMLFSKLGRSRVSIVVKKSEEFEKPSDIDGILYLQYEKSVDEIRERLSKELNTKGYSIKL